MERSYEVSGKNKNKYHDIVDNPVLSPDFARTGDANPNLRVITISFDGTWNDASNIPKGERQTIVATTHEKLSNMRNEHMESFYYKGVGTANGIGKNLINMVEGITGMGCMKNARTAHADVVKQVELWKLENPDIQVHIHVTGFSRGSATALHFMNLVHENGALSNGANSESTPNLAPGKVKTSAVLLDCVSTGQSKILNLSVPDSTISLLHVIADGEMRNSFKVRKVGDKPNEQISFGANAYLEGAKTIADGSMFLYKQIQEVTLPSAAHSDVGGSYGDGNIREISEYIAERFMKSLGLPIKPVKPTFEHIQHVRAHDSRFKIQGLLDPKDENELQKVSNRKEEKAEIVKDEHNVVIMDCTYKGLDQGKTSSKTYAFPMMSHDPVQEPSLKHVGKLHEITLSFENGMPKLSGGGKNSPFHFKNDVLMFSDKVVPNLSRWQHMLEQHNELKATGLPVDPIQISIDFRRNGIRHDANQVGGVAPPAQFIEPVDPWPAQMRKTLMQLNETTQTHPKDASIMYNIAAESAAMDLMASSSEIKNVKVCHSVLLNKTSQGLVRTNEVFVSCGRESGPDLSIGSAAHNEDERNIHTAMRAISRGLGMIGDKFRLMGFKPDTTIQKTYTADGEIAAVQQNWFIPIDQETKGELRAAPAMMGIFNNLARGGLPDPLVKKNRLGL